MVRLILCASIGRDAAVSSSTRPISFRARAASFTSPSMGTINDTHAVSPEGRAVISFPGRMRPDG